MILTSCISRFSFSFRTTHVAAAEPCLTMSSNAALHRLLSKPNAVEAFNLRVNLLVKTRTVDEGTPRTESQMIKSFSTLRQKSRDSGTPKFQTGDSAVIVPLVESKDGQPWVLFTHRSYLMRKHRGEIAFPGLFFGCFNCMLEIR